jgi:hypothetical protein
MDRAVGIRTHFAQRLRYRVMNRSTGAAFVARNNAPALQAPPSQRTRPLGPIATLRWLIPKPPARGRWCARCDLIMEALHLRHGKWRWMKDYAALKSTAGAFLCGPTNANAVTSCRLGAMPVLQLVSIHKRLAQFVRHARAIAKLVFSVRRKRQIALALARGGKLAELAAAASEQQVQGGSNAGLGASAVFSVSAASLVMLISADEIDLYGGRTPFCRCAQRCGSSQRCAHFLTWLERRYDRAIGSLSTITLAAHIVHTATAGTVFDVRDNSVRQITITPARADLRMMMYGTVNGVVMFGMCSACAESAFEEHQRRFSTLVHARRR